MSAAPPVAATVTLTDDDLDVVAAALRVYAGGATLAPGRARRAREIAATLDAISAERNLSLFR